MKIIVLGGHGFVGQSVMEELQNKRCSPIALSRRDGFDLLNYEAARARLVELCPDVIINCAAHSGSLHYVTEFAADVVHDNMQMILNTYKLVSEVCPRARVINPMSNCSYPGAATIHKESEWWDGPVHDSVLAYGNTKRLLYVVSRCYQMQRGISSINFLVPNCYGPGDHTDPNKTHALDGMIIRMLQSKREGQREFEIWGTGLPMREWIYVKDLAQMLCDAVSLTEDLVYPINIAQNKAHSIRETAEMIASLIGYNGKLVFNTKYPDGAPVKILDDRLFRERFPEFQFTDIAQGLRETVKYYQAKLEA
ncbi:MAG: NAD-dependent epimerase/dehydratase family protein [Chloroflexi bacterium]|nr:NAD-dependent epimerase/dehydratase family protein [Chloroflexota bacterium]